MDNIKPFFTLIFATIITFLAPLKIYIFLLLGLYMSNVIVALLEDVYNEKIQPSIKKFKKSIFELSLYLFVILLLFVIARLLDDVDSAIFLSKILTSFCSIFYLQNIIKNLKKLIPDNKLVSVLDFLVNVKFINEKFAIFKEFQDWEENKKIE